MHNKLHKYNIKEQKQNDTNESEFIDGTTEPKPSLFNLTLNCFLSKRKIQKFISDPNVRENNPQKIQNASNVFVE